MNAQAMASSVPMTSWIATRSLLALRSRAGSINLKTISGAEHIIHSSKVCGARTVTCLIYGFCSAWSRQGKCISAKASSSTGNTSVGTCTPQIQPTFLRSQVGSPLMWIGVGVALSAWFSVMATKLKRYAILQAFKAVMGEEAEGNGKFNTKAFAPGSPFPWDTTSPSPLPSKPAAVSDDASGTEVDTSPPPDTVTLETKPDPINNEIGGGK